MKHNILFIVDRLHPTESSNGHCVKNMVQQLKNNETTITVLSLFDIFNTYDSDEIHYVSLSYESYKVRLLEKICGIYNDSILTSIIFDWINNNMVFDTIFCVYKPIDSVIAGVKIKTKHPHISLCVLMFDVPLTTNRYSVKEKYIYSRFQSLIKKVCKIGFVFYLKYYAGFLMDKRVLSCNHFVPIGTPNFLPVEMNAETRYKNNFGRIKMVYAGSFWKEFRNPSKMLDALMFIKDTNIDLILFSWGCEDIVNKYVPLYEGHLIVKGRIGSEELKEELANCDCFINLSNDILFQVPGKFFEYVGYGKPIINFRFIENDSGLADYKKYPLIHDVGLYNPVDTNAIETFIIDNVKKRIGKEELLNLYYEDTPCGVNSAIMSKLFKME